MSYKKTFSELKKKKQKALIPFVVIGDPDYETSLRIVRTIVEAGADILELGFPFSDPIADGPIIQSADVRALESGINTDSCLRFIKEVRTFTDIPIGLLVHYNLIYQRRIDKFFEDCKGAGVTSVLAADVPIEESDLIIKAARKNNVDTVFIVSPLTEGKRLEKILKNCRGFVYIVSRLGVTGARDDLQESTLSLIKRIRTKTNLPLCVGFGISKPEHVRAVLEAGADGAIVGSAIVKIIEKNPDNKNRMLGELRSFVDNMKAATK
ncbi:MAG: tryptophan synthase subunit alpha [Nanoarchaeota archaeon]|nr:tryptophan synthase subunit alpha [Nanoarchaeota archaeon]